MERRVGTVVLADVETGRVLACIHRVYWLGAAGGGVLLELQCGASVTLDLQPGTLIRWQPNYKVELRRRHG